MKNRFAIALTLLTIMGLFLRVVLIDQSPSNLTIDEMSIGYNAFSISQSLKDEWGKRLPLVFRAFGDYKLPLYIYLTAPVVALMGMSNLSVKLISIFSGTLAIPILYLLTFRLTKSKTIAVASSAILIISPWAIQISRIGLESNLALFIFISGITLYLYATEKQKPLLLILTGALFALTFYSYVAYRLVVILLLLSATIIQILRHQRLKPLLILWLGMGIFLLPLTPHLLGESGLARAKQRSVFTNEGIPLEVNELRSYCYLFAPDAINAACYLLYNKVSIITYGFLSNYTKFLSPHHLFLEGTDSPYLSPPGHGEFLPIFILFYPIGLIYWLKHKGIFNILTLWYLIAPIPASLVGVPQIVRGSPLLIPVIIFTAIGFFHSINYLKTHSSKYLFVAANMMFLLGVFVSFGYYFINYLYVYPFKYDTAQYEISRDVGQFLNEQKDLFERIYIKHRAANEHIFVAYHTQMEPAEYQMQVEWPDENHLGFTHPEVLGKYEFGDKSLQDVVCRSTQNSVLYITDDEQPLEASKIFKSKNDVFEQAWVYEVQNASQLCDELVIN